MVGEIAGGVADNIVQCRVLNHNNTITIALLSCDADPALFTSFECDQVTMKFTLRIDKILYPTFNLNCSNKNGLVFANSMDSANADDIFGVSGFEMDSGFPSVIVEALPGKTSPLLGPSKAL